MILSTEPEQRCTSCLRPPSEILPSSFCVCKPKVTGQVLREEQSFPKRTTSRRDAGPGGIHHNHADNNLSGKCSGYLGEPDFSQSHGRPVRIYDHGIPPCFTAFCGRRDGVTGLKALNRSSTLSACLRIRQISALVCCALF